MRREGEIAEREGAYRPAFSFVMKRGKLFCDPLNQMETGKRERKGKKVEEGEILSGSGGQRAKFNSRGRGSEGVTRGLS